MTHLQNFSLTKINRNSYSFLHNLQRHSSSAIHNSNFPLNNLPTRNLLKVKSNLVLRRLKVTPAEEEKKAVAVVKKNITDVRTTESARLVTYLTSLTSHALYSLPAIPIVPNYYAVKAFSAKLKDNAISTQRHMKARLVNRILAANNMSLGECFDAVAEANVNDVMMYFEDTKWTYKQVEILANKITNYFLCLNYEKGDVVGLLVTNRPEYVTLVLGLSKIGVISALININFKEESLLHSVKLSDCKGLIVSEDLLPELNKVKNKLHPDVQIFQLDGILASKNFVNLSDALIASPDRRPEIIYKVHHNDPLVYIYSSGYTSLPEAAMVPHSKFISNSIEITYALNLKTSDIIYNPLPLYHTAGLIVGTGPSAIFGVPVVIRRKFSINKYWSDCKKYKCTIGQYVGPIGRHLLQQPPSPDEKSHNVRKMLGNGLNKGMWKEFEQRFNVEIAEISDNTDGTINIDRNTTTGDSEPLFLPKFLRPTPAIKLNLKKLKSPQSNHELSQTDEPGTLMEAVKSLVMTHQGSIINIRNKTKTAQKIIRNIFKKHDAAANPRDILAPLNLENVATSKDTYCWKGETIATKKVELVISSLTDLSQCAVYGVSMNDMQEKAGMALIADPERKVNLNLLANEIEKYLPYFACPVFVRLTDDLNFVSTLEDKKRFYADEGFDPTKIKDRLYYIDEHTKIYRPLTEEVYRDIVGRKIVF